MKMSTTFLGVYSYQSISNSIVVLAFEMLVLGSEEDSQGEDR